jgi:hypothetical protein
MTSDEYLDYEIYDTGDRMILVSNIYLTHLVSYWRTEHSELLGFWTLSIVQYSKDVLESESVSVQKYSEYHRQCCCETDLCVVSQTNLMGVFDSST